MNLRSVLKQAKNEKIHSTNHLLILAELAANEKPILISDLAKNTDSDPAAVRVTIAGLQDKKLVQPLKITDPKTFKERPGVALTPKAIKLLKRILSPQTNATP